MNAYEKMKARFLNEPLGDVIGMTLIEYWVGLTLEEQAEVYNECLDAKGIDKENCYPDLGLDYGKPGKMAMDLAETALAIGNLGIVILVDRMPSLAKNGGK
jgi:hypothetical protein